MASESVEKYQGYHDELRAALSQNLLIARQVRQLTQDELATASGVSRTTIVQLEDGKGDPRLTTVVNLASALGVAPILLLMGKEEMLAIYNITQNPPSPAAAAEAQLRTMSQLLQAGLRRPSKSREGSADQPIGQAIGAAVGSMLLPGMGTSIGSMLGAMLERKTVPAGPLTSKIAAIDPVQLAAAAAVLSTSQELKMAFEMLRQHKVENRSFDEISRTYTLEVTKVETNIMFALAKFLKWNKANAAK
jgi:DNA-binding XRE family transcriptional regulator